MSRRLNDEISSLAAGISCAIAAMNNGKPLEFLLIVAVPDSDGDVNLSTVTAIKEGWKLRRLADHLHDVADTYDIGEVKGHA